MKKIIVLIIIAVMGMLLMCGCFGLNLLQGTNNTATDDLYKDTPEEAIEMFLEKNGYDQNLPHNYIIAGQYLFMLYNDISNSGMYTEDTGYVMTIPWGSKFEVFVPEISHDLISSVGITKIGSDYTIEIQGYKEIDGISTITENSPIKVYDSNGQELEKLYNEGEEAEACVWITVQNGLADDYAIYADYDGQTYTVIDAKKIKELVG